MILTGMSTIFYYTKHRFSYISETDHEIYTKKIIVNFNIQPNST
jgi:hypothetical protein